MKRGAWLLAVLLSLPLVSAQTSIGEILFGSRVSEEYLLRAFYFMLVFVAFYKLSKQSVFKEGKEQRFAVIFSMCISLIVMWFTPFSILRSFEWLLIFVAPFFLSYWIVGLIIRKGKEEEKKVDWVRILIALLITFLLFIGLADSIVFKGYLNGISFFAFDELFQDINYWMFGGLSPIWTMIAITLALIGILRFGEYIFSKEKSKEGRWEVGWLKWIGIALLVFAFIYGLLGVGGLFGPIGWLFVGIAGYWLYAVIALVVILVIYLFFRFKGWKMFGGGRGKWFALVLAILLLIFAIFYFSSGIFGFIAGNIWYFLGGALLLLAIYLISRKSSTLKVKINYNNGTDFPARTTTSANIVQFRLRIISGGFRRVDGADVNINVNTGEMVGPGGGRGANITGKSIKGEFNFDYILPDRRDNLAMTIIVSGAGYNASTQIYNYTIGGGSATPIVTVVATPNPLNVGQTSIIVVNVAGAGIPADGVDVNLLGLPAGTHTAIPGQTVGNNFTVDFTPNAPGSYSIRAEATHSSFAGRTARGFVNLVVNTAQLDVNVNPISANSTIGSTINFVINTSSGGRPVDANLSITLNGTEIRRARTTTGAITIPYTFVNPGRHNFEIIAREKGYSNPAIDPLINVNVTGPTTTNTSQLLISPDVLDITMGSTGTFDLFLEDATRRPLRGTIDAVTRMRGGNPGGTFSPVLNSLLINGFKTITFTPISIGTFKFRISATSLPTGYTAPTPVDLTINVSAAPTPPTPIGKLEFIIQPNNSYNHNDPVALKWKITGTTLIPAKVTLFVTQDVTKINRSDIVTEMSPYQDNYNWNIDPRLAAGAHYKFVIVAYDSSGAPMTSITYGISNEFTITNTPSMGLQVIIDGITNNITPDRNNTTILSSNFIGPLSHYTIRNTGTGIIYWKAEIYPITYARVDKRHRVGSLSSGGSVDIIQSNNHGISGTTLYARLFVDDTPRPSSTKYLWNVQINYIVP